MLLEEYKGYKIRPGTLDKYVVNELTGYRHMPVLPGDIVMDIGANIGVYAKHAASKGAGVICIEPDPENFQLLTLNCPTVFTILGAVTAHAGATALYKNVGMNKGMHSVIPTRGREMIEVAGFSFTGLLECHTPNKLKIDCEGAEYEFLKPAELPDAVKWVIIELHLSRKDQHEQAVKMHADFLAAGFAVIKPPRFGTKAWATLACYERA